MPMMMAWCGTGRRWPTCKRSRVQCSLHPLMVNRIMAILLTAFLALTLISCGKDEQEQKPEVTVQAAIAHTSDISRVINAEAIIFPVAQSIITPKINAPVKKFYVTRGQKVKQ